MKSLLLALLVAPIQATPPVSVITADCAGVTFITSGYPEGTTGMFSIGDEPPGLLVLNTSKYQAWPGDIDDQRKWWVMVDTSNPSTSQSGQLTCPATMAPPEPEPEIVDIGSVAVTGPTPVPAPVPTPVIDYKVLFADVALAPPW